MQPLYWPGLWTRGPIEQEISNLQQIRSQGIARKAIQKQKFIKFHVNGWNCDEIARFSTYALSKPRVNLATNRAH